MLIRVLQMYCTVATALAVNTALATELDPQAVNYVLPEKIERRDNAARTNPSTILYGIPANPDPTPCCSSGRRET